MSTKTASVESAAEAAVAALAEESTGLRACALLDPAGLVLARSSAGDWASSMGEAQPNISSERAANSRALGKGLAFRNLAMVLRTGCMAAERMTSPNRHGFEPLALHCRCESSRP